MLQMPCDEDGETELGEFPRKAGAWRLGLEDDKCNGD